MLRAPSAVIALLVIVCASAYARERSADEDLRYYLKAPAGGGDVFTQGKLDGIDYRKLLRGAVAYDRPSLVGLFPSTAPRHLLGEGEETNRTLLLDLLEHGGVPP